MSIFGWLMTHVSPNLKRTSLDTQAFTLSITCPPTFAARISQHFPSPAHLALREPLDVFVHRVDEEVLLGLHLLHLLDVVLDVLCAEFVRRQHDETSTSFKGQKACQLPVSERPNGNSSRSVFLIPISTPQPSTPSTKALGRSRPRLCLVGGAPCHLDLRLHLLIVLLHLAANAKTRSQPDIIDL